MKYRKKPVVIEAVQWNDTNIDEIKKFVGNKLDGEYPTPEWLNCVIGDYIIKDETGEVYPCKQDMFEIMYEPIE